MSACNRNCPDGKSLLQEGEGSGLMDYFAAMRAFARAVELGSFSKAAEEAEVKVSTVSRYVSALEQDLGAALLNRSTRRLHLTEAGQAFYERSAQILADIDDARNATRSLNARPQGLLRINIPSAFGRLCVMPHMKDFLAAYPDIRLDATLTDATVDLIKTGADIAVRIGALTDSSLVARRLAPQRRVLVASPQYLAAAPVLNAPADLTEHQCLAFALQRGMRGFIGRLAKKKRNPSRYRSKANCAPMTPKRCGTRPFQDLASLFYRHGWCRES